MKVSLNKIKQFVDFELPPTGELANRINMQLGQIEEIIDLVEQYKDVVIVKVMACEKHPDADRLSVCLVDDGGKVQDIERDERGYVQVVCGAPNVHVDMFAAWLPPRSTVPASFGTDEPFVLGTRELRGVMSNGMMAAADELALGSDHGGIIELTDDDLPPESTVDTLAPGLSFAEVFGLNDTVIDIENKMFTHRPDCFGQLGVAREIAGILGRKFVSPEWYTQTPQFAGGEGLDLAVFNEAPDKVPRFMAVALRDVVVKPSPLWLQIELIRMGGKPINNIVDATNYVMLVTGQPTHAYDYDKLAGATLGVRMARDGEKTTLLNGKNYQLTTDDIVIVDGDGIVGLGGVMGGGDSEVSADTTNVVLEVATFDMYAIRKTSMRHGLFTDAVTRFSKGQSPLQNDRVLNMLINMIGATQASEVFDISSFESGISNLEITTDFINGRLGLRLDAEAIKSLIENVEIKVDISLESNIYNLSSTIPFWRTDLELPEDIVEEVGRLYGLDKLPLELPSRSIMPAPKNPSRSLKQNLRQALKSAGANEVLTYSFVHEKIIANAGQKADNAYRLGNALSPDLQYYRLSVMPSLLDKVHANIKAGFDEFVLFEIGKGHSRALGLNDEGLPVESELLDMVLARKKPGDSAPYFQARRIVEQLLSDVGVKVVLKPTSAENDSDKYAPFDLERSAIVETLDGMEIGVVGEFKQSVRANFKLPEYTAGASLSLDALAKVNQNSSVGYEPLSRFPSTTQDISLKSDSSMTYDELKTIVDGALSTHSEVKTVVEPLMIYRDEADTESKTTTLRITFTSHDKTLSDEDVNPIMDEIASQAGSSGVARV